MNENDPEVGRLSFRKVRILPRRRGSQSPSRRRVRSEQLKKGIYLIPSLFTTGNLFCGFFSIISTVSGQYLRASIFILL